MRRFALVAISLLGVPAMARGGDAPPADPDGVQFFENRVRPLLVDRCYSCHSAGAKKLKAELYADSREGLLKGGESGSALVPGHPEQSRLIEAVRYGNPDLQMPPKTKLSDEQVADFEQWVKHGATWPADRSGNTAGAAGAPARPAFDLAKRKREHWAWQPVRAAAPPAVKDGAWPAGAIDRFVLAKLEDKGLAPAPPADRRTLVRRAYFDLVGLPPTPAQVRAFLEDPAPDAQAFAKVVDELLASPHFGERWARHWLDLVRYAESRGHEFDPAIPNAWQYRDYVVRALNADVPYDQFVTEHLAGDLLEHPRLNPDKGFNESVLGTGFWFLGEEVHSPVDIRQDEADRMNSRLDTMTKAFLGLTVGCARCHDHKFDAISTKDYYALTGVLLSSAYRQVPFESLEQNRQLAQQLQKLRTDARPGLLRLAADVQRAGIDRAADYLLAARAVLLGHDAPSPPDGPALDAKALAGWVGELRAARGDAGHPLHAFAAIFLNPEAGKPEALAALLRAARERAAAAPRPNANEQVIADYTHPGASCTPLWQDGFTFGAARAGEFDLSGGVEPAIDSVPYSAVRRDPAWPAVHDRASEHDYGALGEFGRPGRTFRTPKAALRSGSVWYLVRGGGRVYAAVDSHLLVAGPLHGALLMEFKAEAGHWQWVRHDLTAYAGQRVQFEFTPIDAGPFAVAKVVESDERPADVDPAGPLVAALAADASVRSVESLARAEQAQLADVSAAIGADKIVGAPDAEARAPLADWLLRHPVLFAADDDPGRLRLEGAVRAAAAAQADLLKGVRTTSQTAPAVLDGNGVDENVLVRGVAHNTGDLVPRRFLEAIGGTDHPYPKDSSGRLQLARDVLSPDDPFASRVIVNRVWQHLLGTGIVPTVDNFGVLGQPPTHPELLDYLADEFRGGGRWSVKTLVREIVLSRTYQMSSRSGDANGASPGEARAEQLDPRDALLHRMPVRRLEAEAIRDEILAVSGRLDAKVGGPSVDVYLTEFMEGRGRPGSGPLDGAGRRSLYVKVRRNFLPPMMLAYDMPIPFATVGRRSVSNVPAQALILMNDPFVIQQAEVWAKHVLSDGGLVAGAAGVETPANRADTRIARMYEEAFARPPTADELHEGRAFLEQQGESYGLEGDRRSEDSRVWADFAHVLFNVKEFIFVR